MVDMGGVENL